MTILIYYINLHMCISTMFHTKILEEAVLLISQWI